MAYCSLITVEPAMFLEMAADTLTYVIFQNLFIEKICLNQLNYSAEVCYLLNESNNSTQVIASDPDFWLPIVTEIQEASSQFVLYNALVDNFLPVILVLLLGVWSDAKRRRKPPLLLALSGKLAKCLGLLANSYFFHWSPLVLLLTTALPNSLGGSNAVFCMAAFSYVGDTSVPRQRTLRLGIAEACWQLGTPVGLFLGVYLFEIAGYKCVFAAASLLNFLAVMYTSLWLSEVTPPQPSFFSRGTLGTDESETSDYGSIKRNRCYSETVHGGPRGSLDTGTKRLLESQIPPTLPEQDEEYGERRFASIRRVASFLSVSVKTMFRSRPNHIRKCLLIISVIMLFSLVTLYGEINMKYLFTRNKFQWREVEFSNWTVFDGIMIVIGLTCAMPVFSHVLKLSDTCAGVLSSLFRCASKLCIILAPSDRFLYTAVIIDVVGIIGPLTARSLASKCVLRDERGKVFAFLGFIEATVPLFAVPLYSIVYSSTLTYRPETIYIMSLGFNVVNFILFLSLFIAEKSNIISISRGLTPSFNDKRNDKEVSDASHLIPKYNSNRRMSFF